MALHLLMVVPVCVASGKSFSKFMLIKNHSQSTTNGDRLNHLLTLRLNMKLLEKLFFENVVNDFAEMKPRKKVLVFITVQC